ALPICVLPIRGLHVVHEAVIAFLSPQPVDVHRLAVADRGLDHLRDGGQVVGERVEDRVVIGEQAAHGVGLTLGEASAFGGDGVGQAAHFATQPVFPVPVSLTYKVSPAAPSVRMYSEPTAATTTPSGDPAPVSRD